MFLLVNFYLADRFVCLQSIVSKCRRIYCGKSMISKESLDLLAIYSNIISLQIKVNPLNQVPLGQFTFQTGRRNKATKNLE